MTWQGSIYQTEPSRKGFASSCFVKTTLKVARRFKFFISLSKLELVAERENQFTCFFGFPKFQRQAEGTRNCGAGVFRRLPHVPRFISHEYVFSRRTVRAIRSGPEYLRWSCCGNQWPRSIGGDWKSELAVGNAISVKLCSYMPGPNFRGNLWSKLLHDCMTAWLHEE